MVISEDDGRGSEGMRSGMFSRGNSTNSFYLHIFCKYLNVSPTKSWLCHAQSRVNKFHLLTFNKTVMSPKSKSCFPPLQPDSASYWVSACLKIQSYGLSGRFHKPSEVTVHTSSRNFLLSEEWRKEGKNKKHPKYNTHTSSHRIP